MLCLVELHSLLMFRYIRRMYPHLPKTSMKNWMFWKTLNKWRRRKLTLLGKINIVKSVGLSKLIYNASVLPVPENFCDQVTKSPFGMNGYSQ